MSIRNEINDLLQAGVINKETAVGIEAYYQKKSDSSPNKLFTVFGVLGSLLAGLGIILIIAHNWDELTRALKTFFAFLPMVIGQAACFFTLFRRRENQGWREGSGVFLFFGVGAAISLVSQIYNIPGDLNSFLLTWMLLCLPLIYIMQSSVVSILFINGITYYAANGGYWTYPSKQQYFYWLLLLAVIPHYFWLWKNTPQSNNLVLHHWFVPLSLTIALGTVAVTHEAWLFAGYMCLFGSFNIIGSTKFFDSKRKLSNGYLLIGSTGSIIILLILSFSEPWSSVRNNSEILTGLLSSPEFVATLLLSIFAGFLLIALTKRKKVSSLKPLQISWVIFLFIFVIGADSKAAIVLDNILVFSIGLLIINQGAREDHLGVLNYGLSIIAALVLCRFFDTDLSFVLRGSMFLFVGISFFAANYLLIKKRKNAS